MQYPLLLLAAQDPKVVGRHFGVYRKGVDGISRSLDVEHIQDAPIGLQGTFHHRTQVGTVAAADGQIILRQQDIRIAVDGKAEGHILRLADHIVDGAPGIHQGIAGVGLDLLLNELRTDAVHTGKNNQCRQQTDGQQQDGQLPECGRAGKCGKTNGKPLVLFRSVHWLSPPLPGIFCGYYHSAMPE